MIRRAAVLVAALALAACGDCGDAKCDGGITFFVADVAGGLARGTTEPLHICLDGTCQDVTISRDDAGGTVFIPFDDVGKAGDHYLTVTGIGSLHGGYKGPLAVFVQKPNGSTCPGSCALASVKIASDGTLTPGVPASAVTPSTAAAASTING